MNKENIISIIISVIIVIIIILISFFVLKNLNPYPNEVISCSIWNNGSLYGEPFNCYCPISDYALYINLRNELNCNSQYVLSLDTHGSYYFNEFEKREKGE